MIKELDSFFRLQGFRVLCPQEGAEVIRHIERNTPLYNLRTALYAVQLLIDLSSGNQYDLVIFDRCIFDAYSWMEYWRGKNKLTDEEKSMIQSFFLLRFWASTIDSAYFMIADPKVAMEREKQIALSKKLGSFTNPDSIRNLVEQYRKTYSLLSPQYPQLHLVDTSSIDAQIVVQMIAGEVLETLFKKAKSGR